ncbi:hypothetical protein Pelo_9256 [Pelomyxa schiedti]|nr:hypothetical protein Pelo_9256 [Pelomyxa schiedti]
MASVRRLMAEGKLKQFAVLVLNQLESPVEKFAFDLKLGTDPSCLKWTDQSFRELQVALQSILMRLNISFLSLHSSATTRTTTETTTSTTSTNTSTTATAQRTSTSTSTSTSTAAAATTATATTATTATAAATTTATATATSTAAATKEATPVASPLSLTHSVIKLHRGGNRRHTRALTPPTTALPQLHAGTL